MIRSTEQFAQTINDAQVAQYSTDMCSSLKVVLKEFSKAGPLKERNYSFCQLNGLQQYEIKRLAQGHKVLLRIETLGYMTMSLIPKQVHHIASVTIKSIKP